MKLQYFWEELDRVDEANIRGMKELAKKHKNFSILFHADSDGVLSGIIMKHILQNEYRLKLKSAQVVQYGKLEGAIRKLWDEDTLIALVDFSTGKAFVNIWTDHHASQKGLKPGTSTSFVDAPANAYHLSADLSKRLLSPMEDLEIISTVDSADFYSHGLSPDDIMRAAFGLNKELSIKENHWRMGLVVNKLLLSYKNKPDFLNRLVKQANPSLISLYNVIRRLAKKEGYTPPEEIEKQQQAYNVAQQKKKKPSKTKEMGQDADSESKEKAREADISQVKKLKNGESIMVDDTVVQYGGGVMGKGYQYDRYSVFKNNPDANFLVISWPMGVMSCSANPFKGKTRDVNLIEILRDQVLSKYQSEWENIDVSLAKLKKDFEEDVTKKDLDDAVGFTFDDLINKFDREQIKGVDVEDTGKWKDIVQDISNKLWKDLSDKQRNILSKIKISAWDIIMAGIGGHKSIAMLPNLNFLGKGYTDTMKEIMAELAKELNKL